MFVMTGLQAGGTPKPANRSSSSRCDGSRAQALGVAPHDCLRRFEQAVLVAGGALRENRQRQTYGGRRGAADAARAAGDEPNLGHEDSTSCGDPSSQW